MNSETDIKTPSARKPHQKELTRKQIEEQLKDILNPASFRMNAAECGVLQQAREEIVAGRKTHFFPPDSVAIMRDHIQRKKAGRGPWASKEK